MRKVLIIANYKKSVGGISGVIHTLMTNFNTSEEVELEIYNTKRSLISRMFLIFGLTIKAKNFNVLHVHGCSNFGFYPIIVGVIAGKILKKKIVITYHGGLLENFINNYSIFVKFFLSKATILTVPSSFLADILEKKKVRVEHIPNPIRLNNVYFKERKKISPDIVVTRSFEEVYNIPLAIHAFSKIQETFPDSSLRLVGDGSLEDELKTLVKKLNLKNVIFTGRISNDEIGEQLNQADIFVNPSKADNMPISLFEAFACGLPVISTDVGGIRAFIKHQHNGLLIESENIEQLVNNILFILADSKQTKSMINEGYNCMLQYSFDNLKDQYLELYK